MEGRGGDVLAVAVLFLILTWLTISLRIYVRGFMLKKWGNDDTAMFVTVVSLISKHRRSHVVNTTLTCVAHIHCLSRLSDGRRSIWDWAT
jgi:hypothetical protein